MIGRMIVRCTVGIGYFPRFFGFAEEALFLEAFGEAALDFLTFALASAFTGLALASAFGFFDAGADFFAAALVACFSAARVACSSSATVSSFSPSASDSIRTTSRSEERRVGKECRSRWSPY